MGPLTAARGSRQVPNLTNLFQLGRWVHNHLGPEARARFESSYYYSDAKPEQVTEWLKSEPTTHIPLPFHFSKWYDLRLARLDLPIEGASAVFFASPPQGQEVIPMMVFVESWHNSIIRLAEPYYFDVGFADADTRHAFLHKLHERVFPREARGMQNLLGRTEMWEAGTLETGGESFSLALLSPRTFELVLRLEAGESMQSAARVQAPRPIPTTYGDLLSGSDTIEKTGRGTTYFFKRFRGNGIPIGFMTHSGECFRFVGMFDEDAARPFASHAEILRRQLDPFGTGLVTEKVGDQLHTAERAVRNYLEHIGLEKSYEHPKLPHPAELADFAGHRLQRVKDALHQTTAQTELEHALLGVEQGINPWEYFSSAASRRQFLRFVWINNDAAGKNFFATKSDLLHWQMAVMFLGGELYNQYYGKERPDHPIGDMLRGGLMALDYYESGYLHRISVADGGMLVLSRDRLGYKRVVMTGEEAAKLQGELMRGKD